MNCCTTYTVHFANGEQYNAPLHYIADQNKWLYTVSDSETYALYKQDNQWIVEASFFGQINYYSAPNINDCPPLNGWTQGDINAEIDYGSITQLISSGCKSRLQIGKEALIERMLIPFTPTVIPIHIPKTARLRRTIKNRIFDAYRTSHTE